MIVIHSPKQPMHDYLNVMYFAPFRKYATDQGLDVSEQQDIREMRNCTAFVDTEYLSADAVAILKNNGCKIVGFNLVDSSYIAAPLRDHPEDCELIFSITGLQTTNIGHELEFDDNFQPKLVERRFLPEDQWAVFNMLRMTGRMLSLPYVHWEKQPEPGHLPFGEKNGKVLVRGGAHLRRVTLAFFLMRAGLLDENSGLPLKNFFSDRMNSGQQFCDECRSRYHRSGNRYIFHSSAHSDQCSSMAEWGGDRINLQHTGAWNNRCPRSFYWLAEKFAEHHGPISPAIVEDLFNAEFVSVEDHQRMLRRASFTADLKWIHSIYAAQRFWDAAICGTVNLLPSRTMDQEYFPALKVGEHYTTFFEETAPCTDQSLMGKEYYNHIVNNCWSLYAQWIRPTDYAVSTNLLAHILERVQSI